MCYERLVHTRIKSSSEIVTSPAYNIRDVYFNYSMQGNIRPRFIFAPFALKVSGSIPLSHIISFKIQQCLGEFNTGRNCLQV